MMNKRMEELLTLACKQALFEPVDPAVTITGGDEPVTVARIIAEKFAELIVRECGAALNPMLRDMVSRGQAYDLIKKHFGVEE
jgi:hypothetical protein